MVPEIPGIRRLVVPAGQGALYRIRLGGLSDRLRGGGRYDHHLGWWGGTPVRVVGKGDPGPNGSSGPRGPRRPWRGPRTASCARPQAPAGGTEDKIAFSRQFYNDTVLRYNTLRQSFPATLLAGALGFGPREYFELEEEARQPVAVKF
jgi:hypothetical protein